MPRAGFQTVDEYIASFPDRVQDALQTVRRTIAEAVPDAEEVISYQVPAFRLDRVVLYFAAFKRHYSVFCPQLDSLLAAFGGELAGYEMSKGTIKFPLDRPVPVDLIRRLAEHRAGLCRGPT